MAAHRPATLHFIRINTEKQLPPKKISPPAAVPSAANIAANIDSLRQKIARACQAAGRRPEEVRLIAVAKTFAAEDARAAAAAGVLDIGENYMQEAAAKMEALAELPLTWHFVGRLQGNKAAAVARRFDWAHSVDSESLARRLSAARAGMSPLNIFLQVNIDSEKSKSGFAPSETTAAVKSIAALPNLRLRGLMAIPRPREMQASDEEKRAPIRTLAALQKAAAQESGAPLDAMSAGMSDDFEEAIAEGATHIRIGRALFGHRPLKSAG